MVLLSFEEAAKELASFGLTGNQARTYVALVQLRAAPVRKIAQLSKIRREEIYRMMPKLERLGLVEKILGKPTKYKPISLEEALSILIKYRQEESERKIAELAEKKLSLLKDIEPLKNKKAVTVEEEEGSPFILILDRDKSLRKLISVTDAAEKEIDLTADDSDIQYAVSQGYEDALRNAVMRGVKVRLLLKIDEVSEPLLYFAKEIEPFKDIIEVRHLDQPRLHIMVVDNKETSIGTYLDPNTKKVINLWSDNPSFVNAMKDFFEKQWHESTDINSRIEYLQTGKPVEKTLVLKDPKEAFEKTVELIRSAKKEIFVATIPGRITAFLRNYPIKELRERGVAFRLLVPITTENVNEAKKLLGYSTLKHIDKIDVMMGIADGEHLVFLRHPPPDVSSDPEYKEHFKEMVYTNDQRYLDGLMAFAEQLWDMGVDGRERIIELETGKPIERTEVLRGMDEIYEYLRAGRSKIKSNLFMMGDATLVKLFKRAFMPESLELKNKGARVRLLTNINRDNLEVAEELAEHFEVRHLDRVYMRVVLGDEEIGFSWVTAKAMPEEGIYSNNLGIVHMLWEMAEDAWDNAVDAQLRIDEIRKGKPIRRISEPIME